MSEKLRYEIEKSIEAMEPTDVLLKIIDREKRAAVSDALDKLGGENYEAWDFYQYEVGSKYNIEGKERFLKSMFPPTP